MAGTALPDLREILVWPFGPRLTEGRLGSSGLVSIRLEGFSITIADGNISIEHVRPEPAADALPKAEAGVAGCAVLAVSADVPEAAAVTNGASPANVVVAERAEQSSNGIDGSAALFEEDYPLVTDPPPGQAQRRLDQWSSELTSSTFPAESESVHMSQEDRVGRRECSGLEGITVYKLEGICCLKKRVFQSTFILIRMSCHDKGHHTRES